MAHRKGAGSPQRATAANAQEGQGNGIFDAWQPKYAARGIPTFPVKFVARDGGKFDKVPMVKHWQSFGPRGSTELTRRFTDASGIGFALGTRNGFAVVDVDTRSESVVADALDYYGPSPLISRTPSGGHHIYYRHNGIQRRRIRHPHWSARGAPVDVLGNGLAVLPPSVRPDGEYEFIQGALDDLHRLPELRDPAPALSPPAAERTLPESPLRGKREHDGRNDALFRAIGPAARQIHLAGGTREQVLRIAREHNAQCAQPMEESEVLHIVGNVWKMTVEDRNFIGRPGAFVDIRDLDRMTSDDPDALLLLMFLRAHNSGTFMVANGLAPRLGWGETRLGRARRSLIERGYLKCLRQAGRGHPALFSFGYPY